MDELTQAFQRERVRRAVIDCNDPEELKVICLKVMECNESLRQMLLEKMRADLPKLPQ